MLNERLVPELVQKEFTAHGIFTLAKSLLENESERTRMLEGYERLRSDLGAPGVTERAAQEIMNLAKK